MRILLFSDTHGNINSCIKTIDAIQKVDVIIHAGDYTSDAEDLTSIYPQIPLYYVKGNNDFYSNAPLEKTFSLEEKRVFLTHGHQYNVKYERSYHTLWEKAKQEKADLAVFGHTHSPYLEYRGALCLLNPGSARYSRTYAVVEIEGRRLRGAILETF